MKFKIDENLSDRTKDIFIECGHDCHNVHEEGIAGGTDDALVEICRSEERHLVTVDLDFADIIRYPPDGYAGIIVFRVSRQDPEFLNRRLREVMSVLESIRLPGHLVIVSDERVRFR